MRIESKTSKLTFWRVYWLSVGAMSLWLGTFPLTVYSSYGRLPWAVVEAVLLFELFVFPMAYLMAGFLMWAEPKRRSSQFYWQVSPTHVNVYRKERLVVSIPWNEVLEVKFRWSTIGLKLCRFLPALCCIRGVSNQEYEKVEAMRKAAKLPQDEGIAHE